MILVKTIATLVLATNAAQGAAFYIPNQNLTDDMPTAGPSGLHKPKPNSFPHVHMFPEVQLDDCITESKDSSAVKKIFEVVDGGTYFPHYSAVITTSDYDGDHKIDDGLFIIQNCSVTGTFALEVVFELPETDNHPMTCSLKLGLPSQIYPLPKPVQAIAAYKDPVLRITRLEGTLNFETDSIDNWADAHRGEEWPTPFLGFFDPDTKDWVSSPGEGTCYPGRNNLLVEVAEDGMAVYWYENVRAMSVNRFHALTLNIEELAVHDHANT